MLHKTNTYHHVKEVIEKQLLEWNLQGSSIAVALSGGADSVALLRVLCDLKTVLKLCVSAIHVHHGIRGDEADEDLAFCETLCERYQVPLHSYRVDAPALAEQSHISLESAARQVRYHCFDAYLKENREDRIAMAHHADDNAETVLFRISRGTGLRGLCGIPARRERFIRPCLSLRAGEMRDALAEIGQSYRVDSTNSDVAYTRNFIRHEVLPQIERVHEGAVKNISLMTEGLQEDESYLMEIADTKCKNADVSDMRRVIASEPPSIAKRMLWRLYEDVRCSEDAITAGQLEDALALIRSEKAHARMTLPCGVEMYIDRDMLMFRSMTAEGALREHEVTMGINVFPETGECLILSEEPIDNAKIPSRNIYKLLIHSVLCFDKMDVRLHVRAKRDGDAYRRGGMTRSLKTLYNSKKMSLAARLRRPVLCDDEGILWVPGFGVRDGNDDTKNKGECRIYICYCGFSEKQ